MSNQDMGYSHDFNFFRVFITYLTTWKDLFSHYGTTIIFETDWLLLLWILPFLSHPSLSQAPYS